MAVQPVFKHPVDSDHEILNNEYLKKKKYVSWNIWNIYNVSGHGALNSISGSTRIAVIRFEIAGTLISFIKR